jgi:hypothetical protein
MSRRCPMPTKNRQAMARPVSSPPRNRRTASGLD